jgi:repressor of nif and glnA expression
METGNLFITQFSILEVIQEQKLISSNSLRRRFLGLNERTFRYHLKRLQEKGLIRKRGVTNGVYYEAVKE